MGLRHSGREAAVKILYSIEFSDNQPDAALSDYWLNHKASAKYKEFTLRLVKGVTEKRPEIDNMINSASKNWPIGRIAEIDKNIIRLAVYELIGCNEVPTAVAINEAVELAKQYSGGKSAAFINGILGEIQEGFKKETT
ncbi:MAG: transcription antitermination factor NusB [Nitrospinota bacterium]